MRRGYTHLPPLIWILLLFSPLSYGQAWSGILAPTRAVEWTNTGIPGGIPSASWANCTTTACNAAFSTPTAANISSACSGAPNNTIVRIPAGTYNLSNWISCNRSNVVLRGAGPTQTILNMGGNGIFMGVGSSGQGSPPSGQGSTPLSTFAKGSTVLTVGSTASLTTGQVVVVDQLNDTSIVNVNGFSGGENAGRCGGPSYGFSCSTRAQLEMVQIQSVDSSTQITIKAPGLSRNLSSGLSPQIFYWTNGPSYDGVENVTVNTSADFAVSFPFCNFCWVKNTAVVSQAIRGSVYFLWGYRDEVRDSYIQQSNASGAPTQYGIECDTCTFGKIENNIVFGVTAPLMLETSYGMVVGYNYILNTSSGAQFSGVTSHRAHTFFTLAEGNVGANLSWDFIWGGGSQHTSFRNRFSGHDPNKTSYRIATQVSAWHRYTNVIANVLGDPTLHTIYETGPTGTCSDDAVYVLGIQNNCGTGQSGADTTTYSSLARWGNWDAVTYCTNGGHNGTACGSTGSNGIRYCSGAGAGNSACTASETGSTDPIFPGLANPSTTLPNSFYLSGTGVNRVAGAQPSWWTTPWGTPAWPPIGPDVSCTTNCNANTASHAAMIPAQLCYMNSAKSSGFLTAFDANACYANQSSTSNVNPPTNLSATVN